MKRNMLTIIILAICCMNFILTAVVIFAVVPSANKTNKLISQVAEVIDLEASPTASAGETQVDPKDVTSYTIESETTFNLKRSTDGTDHYGRIDSIVLSINKKDSDYESLNSTISDNENFISDIVSDVISSYTYEEAIENKSQMRDDILTKIQEHFGSEFIFSVSLTNLRFQ